MHLRTAQSPVKKSAQSADLNLCMNFLKFLVNIITVLAFTAEPLLAAQAKANFNKRFNQFLQLTEIHKRKVTLKEFYEKTKSFIPLEARKQIEEVVAKNGDQVLPQFQVSKVKYKGKELPQISFVEGKNSGIITLLDGYYNKKNNDVFRFGEQTFTIEDLNDLPKLAQSLETQASTALKKERTPASVGGGEVGLIPISAEQLKTLNEDQRQALIKYYIEVLSELEKFQSKIQTSQSKKIKKQSLLLNALIQQLHADNKLSAGMKCVVAGWVGTVVQKITNGCDPDKYNSDCLECNPDYGWFWNRSGYSEADSLCVPANNGQQQIACNPILYGYALVNSVRKVFCVDKKNDGGTSAACAKRSSVEKRAQQPVESLTRIVGQVNDLWSQTKSLCADYTTPPRTGSRVEDVGQKKECENLKTRVAAIKAEFCSAAKTNASNASKALKAACDQFQAPAAAAAPAPAPGGRAKGIEAAPAAPAPVPVTPSIAPPPAPAPVTPTPAAEPPAPESPAPGEGDPPAPPPPPTPGQTEQCPLPVMGSNCEEWTNDCLKKKGYFIAKQGSFAVPPERTCDDTPTTELTKPAYCLQSGKTVDVYQCACKPGFNNLTIPENVYYCDSQPHEQEKSDGGYEPRPKPERSSGILGWFGANWSSLLAIILAGGVGYYMYTAQKKQIESAYDRYFIANPPTPPIPLPPPRTAPGTRQ
jgi:hypothetical protein